MQRGESRDYWYLAWDLGPHHMEIELHDDGKFEWFYKNRETNQLAGSEDGDVPFGVDFCKFMQLLERDSTTV